MGLWLLACAAPGEPPGTATRGPLALSGSAPRNVLVVSVDTFRRDRIGRYGGGDLTPFLDGFLEGALSLDAHRSCSNWTLASVACALSGRSTIDLGWVPGLSDMAPTFLPQATPTLASVLLDRGYRTWLISTNSYLSDLHGTALGYEEVDYRGFRPAGEVTDEALAAATELVADADGTPWLLHVHYRDLHAPYDPPPEYVTGLDGLPPVDFDLSSFEGHYDAIEVWDALDPEQQEALAARLAVRYDGAVRYTDDELARLWEGLDALGALDDTLVLFWTDHGEQFWEHGHQAHAWSLHYGENDAVAALRAPGLAPAAWDAPTTHADLLPTVLALLGLPAPEGTTGCPVGEAPEPRAVFAAADTRDGMVQSVEFDGWKLHYAWNGARSAHDRTVDPQEAVDRYDPEDPHVLALWGLLLPEVDRALPLVSDGFPVDAGP